jgi:predicted small metal-binding protein
MRWIVDIASAYQQIVLIETLCPVNWSDMPITITCPRCALEITADGEEELVARVQQHVRDDHELPHTLPRKHILRELRRQSP